MSFLGDIVNSIGGDRVPAPPKPPQRPISGGASRQVPNGSKSVLRPGSDGTPSQLNGLKRKAEDGSETPSEKVVRQNTVGGQTNNSTRVAASVPLNLPKSSLEKTQSSTKPQAEKSTTNLKATLQPGSTKSTPVTNTKPPAKGSYADIMARASQAGQERKQSQVGMIKHQASNKEKLSKVAERRREEQERAKTGKLRSVPRSDSRGRVDKRRSTSPVKKDGTTRVPKEPRPPLHAPQSGYRGTMGTGASRARQNPAKSNQARGSKRYDEYLGTDEEDNSGVDDYGEDDYDSNASSDMEAGVFEVDEEEQRALKAAREDDAKELALEQQLKKEKEERRQRLQGLANKRK